MNRSARVLLVVGMMAALLATTGCTKLRARDQLNKGVASYKNAKYEAAIGHFKNAVSLDPDLINARLYLATAYAQQYIPGADTPENKRMAEQAIEEYKNVLAKNPELIAQVNSVKGIAYLHLQMKQFDQAKEYYRKAIDLDPKDAEPYYSVAVIDWTKSYQPRVEKRAELQLSPDEPIKDKKICQALRDAHLPEVEEGMQMLEKAISLRDNYDDAMAYLNLLYRERADYQCEDPSLRQADIKMADSWVDKTMEAKKRKAEAEAARHPGGITTE